MTKDKVTVVAGCAVDGEIYYISCRLNNLPIDEPYSRLFFYQEKTKEKWFYHDRPDWKVVSICLMPSTPTDERAVCALSEEGDVEILKRSNTTVEKVTDAGLNNDNGLGYVTRIRSIAGELYVCGDQNQIYKRNNGKWLHIDSGALTTNKPKFSGTASKNRAEIIEASNQESCLFDIAGSREDDIYAVGTNGCILHFNGKKWTRFKQISASDLYEIHITPENKLIIVGSKGTIISGNKDAGFKMESRKTLGADFISITEHNNEIFIGASDGIYKKTENSVTRLPLDVFDVSNIESINNIMWATSSRNILKYEGMQWSIIQHIDNTHT